MEGGSSQVAWAFDKLEGDSNWVHWEKRLINAFNYEGWEHVLDERALSNEDNEEWTGHNRKALDAIRAKCEEGPACHITDCTSPKEAYNALKAQ